MRHEPSSRCDWGPVAVVDPSPAYVLGLSTALREGGFSVIETSDQSVAACNWRAVVGSRSQALPMLDVPRSQPLVFVCIVEDGDCGSYRAALLSGAAGVAERDAPLDEIVRVVAEAFAGRVVLPNLVASEFAAEVPGGPAWAVSEDEADWLNELAKGGSVVELSARAGYSERAMHRHLSSLYVRLGARNRTEALLRVERRGVVAPVHQLSP